MYEQRSSTLYRLYTSFVIKAECGLGMPEGKASGGIWAKDCAYFWEKKI